jgi:ferredoxin-NADP reductase
VQLSWQVGTLVERRTETPTACTLVLDVPTWPGHFPGQYVDLRLTAADGYSTQRSYSLASAVDGTRIELTVQHTEDGEVSPWLTGVMEPGDPIELRGPIGGWFVWKPGSQTEPVLLVAGGSGLVPLMAMVRTRRAVDSKAPFRLVYSVRTPQDRLYVPELRRGDPGVDTTIVYTRETPPDHRRPAGRLTSEDLAAGGWPPDFGPTCYVCGPTMFVEAAADLLVLMGHDPARVRTERFG